MIIHIFKICRNQKRENIWIWLELTFVSLILWVVIDALYVKTAEYFSPLGHNINHVYRIEFNSPSQNNNEAITNGEKLLMMADRIRSYQGVEAVAISQLSVPYGTYSQNERLRRDTLNNEKSDIISARVRRVTPDFFRVFGSADSDEKMNSLSNAIMDERNGIINTTLKNILYPNKNAINESVFIGDDTNLTEKIIAGTISSFRNSEFDSNRSSSTLFIRLTEKEISESQRLRYDLTIRVNPAADNNFIERFKREMNKSLYIDGLFMTDITHMSLKRAQVNSNELDKIEQMGLIGLFLLINIFLGVTGTFWYRTRQRKNEMGLRIAMGSTRSGLQQLMIGEGLVLLTLSILPAVIIAFNIGLTDMINVDRMPFTMNRFLITQGVTVWLMALMVCIGIYFPARSISRLQPADALRYE